MFDSPEVACFLTFQLDSKAADGKSSQKEEKLIRVRVLCVERHHLGRKRSLDQPAEWIQ